MSRYQRTLERLDDKAMMNYRIDEAIKLGRLQGETAGVLRALGHEHKYDRTPEYRLMKHQLREYKRIYRRWANSQPFPEGYRV